MASSIAQSPDIDEPWPQADGVDRPSAPGASELSRWTMFAALTIAVIALILTVVQWIHPWSHNNASPAFTNQQVKDAKADVSTACKAVHRAVVTNTHLESSSDGGPLAVATSARLALYGGGAY